MGIEKLVKYVIAIATRAKPRNIEIANSRLAKALMINIKRREATKVTMMYFKVTVTLRLNKVSTFAIHSFG